MADKKLGLSGKPMMGPCTAECEDCFYIFRSGGLPICDYYLQTGEHRYPNEDGSCAVKVRMANGEKYSYIKMRKQQNQQRAEERRRRMIEDPAFAARVTHRAAWDTEQAFTMWIRGDAYKHIGDTVGASVSAIKNYAHNHWQERRPEREANIKARGGHLSPERLGQTGKLYLAAWDTERALQLWLEGVTYGQIAETVGITANNLKGYAHRHWYGMREQRKAAERAREPHPSRPAAEPPSPRPRQ